VTVFRSGTAPARRPVPGIERLSLLGANNGARRSSGKACDPIDPKTPARRRHSADDPLQPVISRRGRAAIRGSPSGKSASTLSRPAEMALQAIDRRPRSLRHQITRLLIDGRLRDLYLRVRGGGMVKTTSYNRKVRDIWLPWRELPQDLRISPTHHASIGPICTGTARYVVDGDSFTADRLHPDRDRNGHGSIRAANGKEYSRQPRSHSTSGRRTAKGSIGWFRICDR